jgi:spore coat polysaccharide biosynthesis protein SpsF (cytidylyltransferase family)
LFWKNPKKFKIKIINKKKNISNYKFSIDYKHDLFLVKKVINKIKISKKYGTADEIVNIIKHDKKLNKISEMSRRKFIKNRNDLTNFI